MEANVRYNDFKGTAAASVSDFLALAYDGGNGFSNVSKYFGLDEQRFNLVGISIYGTKKFGLQLICVDKDKSSDEKEHIVMLSHPLRNKKEREELLDILFKHLNIILYDGDNMKYSSIRREDHEQAEFYDFHETE
jgi:hypothetical protein